MNSLCIFPLWHDDWTGYHASNGQCHLEWVILVRYRTGEKLGMSSNSFHLEELNMGLHFFCYYVEFGHLHIKQALTLCYPIHIIISSSWGCKTKCPTTEKCIAIHSNTISKIERHETAFSPSYYHLGLYLFQNRPENVNTIPRTSNRKTRMHSQFNKLILMVKRFTTVTNLTPAASTIIRPILEPVRSFAIGDWQWNLLLKLKLYLQLQYYIYIHWFFNNLIWLTINGVVHL